MVAAGPEPVERSNLPPLPGAETEAPPSYPAQPPLQSAPEAPYPQESYPGEASPQEAPQNILPDAARPQDDQLQQGPPQQAQPREAFPPSETYPNPTPLGQAPLAPASSESPLPPDLWQGVDPQALRGLLAGIALPSSSPVLAGLVARALATGTPDGDAGLKVRIAALEKAGRMQEIAALAGGAAASPAGAAANVAKASPVQLFQLAEDDATSPELRAEAAERAAALNIIDGTALGKAYREAAAKLPKTAQSGPALRARLFAALEAAPSAKIRAESIEALLASARDQGIEVPAAQALAQASAGLIGDSVAPAFAETGLRVAALAGDAGSAWAWTDAGGERLQSWQLLLAASDPGSARSNAALQQGVEIAMKGGLPAPLLQRLVTVLDALDYDVPIPLWDAASKTPQSNDGYLPATGMLTELKRAADAGETGRTILLVATVLGPKGPQGAHLIALGDAIRALKRVGLDAEARRLGFEALYAHWPARGKA